MAPFLSSRESTRLHRPANLEPFSVAASPADVTLPVPAPAAHLGPELQVSVALCGSTGSHSVGRNFDSWLNNVSLAHDAAQAGAREEAIAIGIAVSLRA